MQVFRGVGELDVRHHRTAFLRQPGHVEHRHPFALDVSGHGKDLADSHHAGAADAGHEHAEGLHYRGALRLRQRGKIVARRQPAAKSSRLALPERAAFDGHKARAEALQAGVVLVAGRLVDFPFAAELGLERFDR